MYDRNYEDYMRMALGYNLNNTSNYEWDRYSMLEDNYNYDNQQNDIDQFYPEIYKIIYPMICKACMNVREPITEDLVDSITNEIFINFEDSRTKETENRDINQKSEKKNTSTYQRATEPIKEDRNQNFLLKDLIRILVLRELLNNFRPGNRPRPPMPPFGRPPMNNPPVNRPPMRPRAYNDLY